MYDQLGTSSLVSMTSIVSELEGKPVLYVPHRLPVKLLLRGLSDTSYGDPAAGWYAGCVWVHPRARQYLVLLHSHVYLYPEGQPQAGKGG